MKGSHSQFKTEGQVPKPGNSLACYEVRLKWSSCLSISFNFRSLGCKRVLLMLSFRNNFNWTRLSNTNPQTELSTGLYVEQHEWRPFVVHEVCACYTKYGIQKLSIECFWSTNYECILRNPTMFSKVTVLCVNQLEFPKGSNPRVVILFLAKISIGGRILSASVSAVNTPLCISFHCEQIIRCTLRAIKVEHRKQNFLPVSVHL